MSNFTKREQELVDLCFQIALTISEKPQRVFRGRGKSLRDLPNDAKAAWVAEKLANAGFTTRPVGASWGILFDATKETFNG